MPARPVIATANSPVSDTGRSAAFGMSVIPITAQVFQPAEPYVKPYSGPVLALVWIGAVALSLAAWVGLILAVRAAL